MSKVGTRQHGFGHIGLIIVIVVLVAVGASGWFVWKQHNGSPSDAAVATAFKKLQCGSVSDKDLCKFFASSAVSKVKTINSTSTTSGKTTKTLYQLDGTSYHLNVSGETSYETIGIGTDIYTKNTADNSWWKQSIPKDDVSKYNTAPSKDDFTAPDSTKTAQPTYKKIAAEKCGPNNKLNCLKYQVVDPSQKDTTEYIWFDTTNYQVQKTQDISGDTTNTATFEYATVKIVAPTPYKTLGANQYLVPGQSTPVTIPTSTTDTTDTQALTDQLKALEQQYQNQQ